MSDILLIQFDLPLYLFDFIVPRIALADMLVVERDHLVSAVRNVLLQLHVVLVDKLYVLYTDIGRITWRGFWGLVVWGFVAIAHQM